MLQSDNYELAFICSEYESATDQVNDQIAAIDKIVKSYDDTAMVIGEAPLMKDLQDVTDVDLINVNAVSMIAIFLIIMIVFKSISLPVILVAVIEFAIAVNMAVPYYSGISLPFVASIVIRYDQVGNRGLCDLDDKPLSERTYPARTDEERCDRDRTQDKYAVDHQ